MSLGDPRKSKGLHQHVVHQVSTCSKKPLVFSNKFEGPQSKLTVVKWDWEKGLILLAARVGQERAFAGKPD